MIPAEMKNLLKTDKTGLVSGHCSVAFTDLLINSDGEMFCCGCEGWVKKSIGNILDCQNKDEFDALLAHDSEFKSSIADGSHRFCDAFKCFYLQRNILEQALNKPFVESTIGLIEHPLERLYLQIDESCNLECPSCRNHKILHKNNHATQKIRKILDQIDQFILPYNPGLIIRLVGNGELFASNTLLPWFLDFDADRFPDVRFFIHSNGTLLSKHAGHLRSIASNIQGFEISIDAATPETYSKVRKNGNWNNLFDGLELISQMRHSDPRISLSMSFVVSSYNYHEMDDFIRLAERFDAHVSFYKILRWNMDNERFMDMNVFSPKHASYEDLKRQILKLNSDKIKIDSNFSYMR